MPLEKDASEQVLIKNKNKIMRKAQDIENDIHMTTYNCGSSIDALNIAFAIDNISTKRSKGYNAFASKKIRNFFKSLAKNYKEKLLVNVLYDKTKPIGYEIGFAVKNTFYGNQIATVAGYEKYSLGRIFIIKLIESLNKKSINKIDFGSGEDHIKKSFTKNYQTLYTIIISKHRHTHMYLNIMLRFNYLTYKLLQQRPDIYAIYRSLKNTACKIVFFTSFSIPHISEIIII
jgi:predicted N-acyltransferase